MAGTQVLEHSGCTLAGSRQEAEELGLDQVLGYGMQASQVCLNPWVKDLQAPSLWGHCVSLCPAMCSAVLTFLPHSPAGGVLLHAVLPQAVGGVVESPGCLANTFQRLRLRAPAQGQWL